MEETWTDREILSIDENGMLVDSAKRLMVISIVLQVLYFVVLLFSDLKKTVLVQANGWHLFEFAALLIIPLFFWFISLTIAMHVLIRSTNYFAVRRHELGMYHSDDPVESIDGGKNDTRLSISKKNWNIIKKNTKYLRLAYYLILVGFFSLLIIAFFNLLLVHEITETIPTNMNIIREVGVANTSQINTTITIPSVVFHLNYSGEEPTGFIHTNVTNATDFVYTAPPDIGYIEAVVIAIGFFLFMIILMWIFGYWISKRDKSNASARWWKYPLGLPKGSVRAMIALLFVVALLLCGKQQDPWLTGIVGAIIGFYFGERRGEEDH